MPLEQRNSLTMLVCLLVVLMVLWDMIYIAPKMRLYRAKRGRALVGTGIALSIPDGLYGRVAPRSGLAVKHCINVGAGVIDPDYTGEVKVVLFNHGTEDFEIKKGDRIAQLILEKCETPMIKEIGLLEETLRGDGGFGSTGS